jgi:hypothetical protein
MVLILNKMNNQEILNMFGELLIAEVYDNHIALVKNDLKDLKQTERFKNLFSNMTPIQKEELEKLSYEILTGMLFDFLRIFEENKEFKLIYESDGNQVDLVKISEMLKAEPIIENGWINRFSQYSNKKSQ